MGTLKRVEMLDLYGYIDQGRAGVSMDTWPVVRQVLVED